MRSDRTKKGLERMPPRALYCALISDGRFSGGTHGPRLGHIGRVRHARRLFPCR